MYLRESFHHLYKKTCWAKTWPIINRRINVLQPQAFVVHSWTDGGQTHSIVVCMSVWAPSMIVGTFFRVTCLSVRCSRRCCFCQHDPGHPKAKKPSVASEASPQLWLNSPHSLRHNRHDNNDDDGCYGDRVRGQAGEKHICRVAFGRRRKRRRWRDGRAAVWVLPLCESFSGLPVHFDTGIRVPEAVREKCVCCCWRGLGAGSKPGVRGLATCPKSKL